jgi:hypothetical protein
MELTNQQVIRTKQEIDPEVLKEITDHLQTWKTMANWLQGSVIVMGFLAIASSLFISAFAGTVTDLAIKIIAFIATLFITLITAFNLTTKASNVRNGWRHLNKAIYSFKTNSIDATALIKAYEEGENMLGSVDFNYKRSQEKHEDIVQQAAPKTAEPKPQTFNTTEPKIESPKTIEPRAGELKIEEPKTSEPVAVEENFIKPVLVDPKTN